MIDPKYLIKVLMGHEEFSLDKTCVVCPENRQATTTRITNGCHTHRLVKEEIMTTKPKRKDSLTPPIPFKKLPKKIQEAFNRIVKDDFVGNMLNKDMEKLIKDKVKRHYKTIKPSQMVGITMNNAENFYALYCAGASIRQCLQRLQNPASQIPENNDGTMEGFLSNEDVRQANNRAGQYIGGSWTFQIGERKAVASFCNKDGTTYKEFPFTYTPAELGVATDVDTRHCIENIIHIKDQQTPEQKRADEVRIDAIGDLAESLRDQAKASLILAGMLDR